MTDINGVPIIGEQPAPAVVGGIAIAQIPVLLEGGQAVFELKLRAPGIIRAVAFWVHEPKVVASAMRGVNKLLMPLLFVECDPAGAIDAVARVFVFIPSDLPFAPKAGWQARYVASAIGDAGAKHLLELVEVQ